LVFDPGLEPDLILTFLQKHNLNPAALVLTHGHADHIGGNAALKEAYPEATILIGSGDAVMLEDAFANLSALFGIGLTSPPADRVVREGDQVELAGITLDVLDIPGHSPGHVVYLYQGNPVVVFGGDVLFNGSIGRTDFPGGDTRLLLEGIQDKLFALPPDTVVYPGHGPTTTIGREKRTNPFAGEGLA
jgi:glyoxylase-like metal-dependent hydrolase (beta-lactamase superfamily II)